MCPSGRAPRLAHVLHRLRRRGRVLKDKAAIFVDGRYTLQVRQQTDTKLFDPRDLIAEGLGMDRDECAKRRAHRL
jgi:hypothetical protein